MSNLRGTSSTPVPDLFPEFVQQFLPFFEDKTVFVTVLHFAVPASCILLGQFEVMLNVSLDPNHELGCGLNGLRSRGIHINVTFRILVFIGIPVARRFSNSVVEKSSDFV